MENNGKRSLSWFFIAWYLCSVVNKVIFRRLNFILGICLTNHRQFLSLFDFHGHYLRVMQFVVCFILVRIIVLLPNSARLLTGVFLVGWILWFIIIMVISWIKKQLSLTFTRRLWVMICFLHFSHLSCLNFIFLWAVSLNLMSKVDKGWFTINWVLLIFLLIKLIHHKVRLRITWLFMMFTFLERNRVIKFWYLLFLRKFRLFCACFRP